LTVVDFLEFGMRLKADSDIDKGVFPRILNPNMTVRFIVHEKHEGLNSSSKFGGVGRWEWLSFPYTQGSTGVGNLFVNSSQPYEVFYGHHWYGNLESPLCQLNSASEQRSTITFSDPHNPTLHLRPHYYFSELNRPSNDELDAAWAIGKELSSFPALIYFQDVPQDFKVVLELPDYGAPGFETSTFFFNFTWDPDHKAIRMVKRDLLHVRDFNYRFCWAEGVANAVDVCPKDYAILQNTRSFSSFCEPTARTVRLALITDFSYDFAFFTATQINIRVFAPRGGRTSSPRLTVPVSFLAGDKFGEIHLHNLTLAFSSVANPKVEIAQVVHLDLHNVSFDASVVNSLQTNGCRDTPFIEADPISYSHIHEHCVPDHLFLDEGTYERIQYSQETFTLYEPSLNQLTIKQTEGRPYEIDIYYHARHLQLDVATGTTKIPKTNIWMPDLPLGTADDLPNYTFGSGWTPATAANLTIDNLLGRFYIATPFVPFIPGGIIRIPFSGPTGIRIYARPGYNITEARVYFPFPNQARLNPDSYGMVLRYEDIEIFQPMTPFGNVEHAIFAKSIKFDRASGINVLNLDFDKANPPILNVEYRLQGGLPRLYLGTVHSPLVLPIALNLIHRGASEKRFIQSHLDFFREFSHEIICGNASLPCQHWNVVFASNATEDPTNDHRSGSSVLRAVCRPQVQGLLGQCLALEIDEYYFPFPTVPPPPPHPYPSPSHPGDGSNSGFTSNSGIGKGVGIGLAVGAVLAAGLVGGIFWWFRKRPSAAYEPAGFSSTTYTTP
jgi:hypothetical protein